MARGCFKFSAIERLERLTSACQADVSPSKGGMKFFFLSSAGSMDATCSATCAKMVGSLGSTGTTLDEGDRTEAAAVIVTVDVVARERVESLARLEVWSRRTTT